MKHSAYSGSSLIISLISSGKTSTQAFQNVGESAGKFSLEEATLATRGEEYRYSPVQQMDL